MSQSASPRSKSLLVVVVALAVAAVVAFALWLLGGDDSKPDRTLVGNDQTVTATTPTPEATTTKPTPKATASCEGPDTLFNVEGKEQPSLLPDCGVAPVTQQQQQEAGLGLACGGTYPVILYKTTTTDAKTSICGKDTSGADFRLVTKPTGGQIVDVKGSYDPQLDAFVGRDGGTSYAVLGYDGSLLVEKGGVTRTQKSSDWISLDNESDYD